MQNSWASFVAQLVKNLSAMQETPIRFRKSCWRRDRLHTPVFLGFLCGSAGKESACNVGDLGSIIGLGISPEEENGILSTITIIYTVQILAFCYPIDQVFLLWGTWCFHIRTQVKMLLLESHKDQPRIEFNYKPDYENRTPEFLLWVIHYFIKPTIFHLHVNIKLISIVQSKKYQ